MPTIPSTSEVTLVNSRFSSACSRFACAARTWASAPSLAWISLSSWLWAIARASASGVSRSTSSFALPSCASACASCAFAWLSAARKGRGSITNRTSPFLDERALLVVCSMMYPVTRGWICALTYPSSVGHPLAVDRRVLLEDIDNLDRGGRDGWRGCAAAAAGNIQESNRERSSHIEFLHRWIPSNTGDWNIRVNRDLLRR